MMNKGYTKFDPLDACSSAGLSWIRSPFLNHMREDVDPNCEHILRIGFVGVGGRWFDERDRNMRIRGIVCVLVWFWRLGKYNSEF